MERLVRGFWGPRPETEAEVATRCVGFLTRLGAIFPGLPTKWHGVRDQGSETIVPADADAVAAHLRAVAGDGNDPSAVGHRIALYATAAEHTAIDIAGNAGGRPQFAPHAIVVQVDGPGGDDRALLATLRALAEEWDIDWGDVTDDDLMDELEDAGLDPGSPTAGRALFLSRGRAARVSGAPLPVGAEPAPHAGAILDLSSLQSTEAVVAVNRSLEATGALQPLPRPMTGPKLPAP
ncbi:Imm52 family immunity protein [Streptomyces anandii]|uniref:Imm52 family immunity protein n=1 Tax=Streptomyces anandii TaxID=285454 RepID=UPI00368543F0